MGTQHGKRGFWTTAPGIIAGVLGLVTALITLASTLIGSGQTPTASVPAGQAASPLRVPEGGCEAMAGTWSWSTGGVTTIGVDGTLAWRKAAHDPLPTVVGQWICLDRGARRASFRWSHGYTDTMALSRDGQVMEGANDQSGFVIMGSRR